MDLFLITYFVLQLDQILSVLSGIASFAGISAFASAVITLMLSGSHNNEEKAFRTKAIKTLKTSMLCLGVLCIAKAVIPTSETAKYMFAAYGVQTAVEAVNKNEDVKRIANKSVAAIENLVDKVGKDKKE